MVKLYISEITESTNSDNFVQQAKRIPMLQRPRGSRESFKRRMLWTVLEGESESVKFRALQIKVRLSVSKINCIVRHIERNFKIQSIGIKVNQPLFNSF